MGKWLALVLGVAALGGGLAASCSSGPEIVGTGTSISGGKKEDKDKGEDKKKGGALFPDDEEGGVLFDEEGNLREEKLGGDEAAGAVGINYPTMDLTGKGSVTCDGDVYGVLGQYTNTIDQEKVDLNFYNASISGAGKGQDKANKKIRESLGQTIYTRLTDEERTQYVKDGYDLQPFAIFAKSAVKTKAGTNFQFSKPLPVFPLPASPARYEELKKGPKQWTAEITGTHSFTVTMTMSLISATADAVTLKFETFIPQDTNRTLYEAWPLAKEAVYSLNPKALEVHSITSVNWFNDTDSCNGPETLNINFKLCKKTVAGVTKDYPCQ